MVLPQKHIVEDCPGERCVGTDGVRASLPSAYGPVAVTQAAQHTPVHSLLDQSVLWDRVDVKHVIAHN